MESTAALQKALDLILEYTQKGKILVSTSSSFNSNIFKTDENEMDLIGLFNLSEIKKQYARIVIVLDESDSQKHDILVDFVRTLQKSYLVNGGIIFLLVISQNYILPRYIRTGADNLTKKVSTKTSDGKWLFQLFAFYN